MTKIIDKIVIDDTPPSNSNTLWVQESKGSNLISIKKEINGEWRNVGTVNRVDTVSQLDNNAEIGSIVSVGAEGELKGLGSFPLINVESMYDPDTDTYDFSSCPIIRGIQVNPNLIHSLIFDLETYDTIYLMPMFMVTQGSDVRQLFFMPLFAPKDDGSNVIVSMLWTYIDTLTGDETSGTLFEYTSMDEESLIIYQDSINTINSILRNNTLYYIGLYKDLVSEEDDVPDDPESYREVLSSIIQGFSVSLCEVYVKSNTVWDSLILKSVYNNDLSASNSRLKDIQTDLASMESSLTALQSKIADINTSISNICNNKETARKFKYYNDTSSSSIIVDSYDYIFKKLHSDFTTWTILLLSPDEVHVGISEYTIIIDASSINGNHTINYISQSSTLPTVFYWANGDMLSQVTTGNIYIIKIHPITGCASYIVYSKIN